MSAKLKLRSNAGGSVSLIVDDTLATDEEVEINASHGIEYGSNTNGYYTKFPDGTLIQWGVVTIADVPLTVVSGSLFRNTSTAIRIDFPLSFIDNQYSANYAPNTFTSIMGITPYAKNSSYMLGIGYSTISQTISIPLDWYAVGRWK